MVHPLRTKLLAARQLIECTADIRYLTSASKLPAYSDAIAADMPAEFR